MSRATRQDPLRFFVLMLTALLILGSCDLVGIPEDLSDSEDEQTSSSAAPAIAMISLGFRTSMLLKDNGILYASGSNGSGEMGDFDFPERFDFGVIRIGVKAAFCGPSAGAFFLHEDGSLYASGNNWDGQLGAGSGLAAESQLITLDDGVKVKQIALSGTATIALDESGQVWVTGENLEKSVWAADGTAPEGDRFTKLSEPGYLEGVKAIAKSSEHSLYILQDGSV